MYVIQKKQKSISLLTSPTLFPKESNHEKQLEVYISRPCFRPLQTCMSVSGYVICLVGFGFVCINGITTFAPLSDNFLLFVSQNLDSTHCQITPSCLALAWHSILYPSLLTAPLLVGIQVAFNSAFFFCYKQYCNEHLWGCIFAHMFLCDRTSRPNGVPRFILPDASSGWG